MLPPGAPIGAVAYIFYTESENDYAPALDGTKRAYLGLGADIFLSIGWHFERDVSARVL